MRVHEKWMRQALDLACRGPLADPNPRVGCVVVADGLLLGAGWHRGAGTPHAEAVALTAAGPAARGATAYITLEPCGHTGRTPPCADALVAAGVAEVVYASSDPNPVACGGAAGLRAAGISVQGGVLAEAANEVNRRWLTAMTNQRPFVTWKFAASLDGRSAAADGSSQWITSTTARADVHRLRGQYQAIMVGTGTVLADDPQLTVRDTQGALLAKQPIRIVVGERSLPDNLRVFDEAAKTLRRRTHDLPAVFAELFAGGIRSLWLEGGPTLAAACWRAGLVDEVVCYLAPTLLGAGSNAVADFGVSALTHAPRLEITDCIRVGPDVRLRAIRKDC